MVTGILGLLLLGRLSAVQVRTWKDAVSMWENCVRVAPDNVHFRCAFADRLARAGQFHRAIAQCEKVLQVSPRHEKAAAKLAWFLVSCDDESIRDHDRALRLAEEAFANDPALFRALARVRCMVAETMAEEEQFDGAIAGYESALLVDPGNQPALLQMSSLLATCRDERLRDPDRAVELAEQACRLKGQPGPEELSVLGTAYAQAGKLEMALRTAEKAVELAQDAGDANLLDELRGQLRDYQERLRDLEMDWRRRDNGIPPFPLPDRKQVFPSRPR
jgi:tetratricopeptide (TPR) repeat protein